MGHVCGLTSFTRWRPPPVPPGHHSLVGQSVEGVGVESLEVMGLFFLLLLLFLVRLKRRNHCHCHFVDLGLGGVVLVLQRVQTPQRQA